MHNIHNKMLEELPQESARNATTKPREDCDAKNNCDD